MRAPHDGAVVEGEGGGLLPEEVGRLLGVGTIAVAGAQAAALRDVVVDPDVHLVTDIPEDSLPEPVVGPRGRVPRLVGEREVREGPLVYRVDHARRDDVSPEGQIGRASCRESVWG